jgi:hypothetical protein
VFLKTQRIQIIYFYIENINKLIFILKKIKKRGILHRGKLEKKEKKIMRSLIA